MDKFESGSESLLQALAVMREEEEFRSKYGGLSDLLSKRRDASVTVLCNIIAKLKKELDSKNKCAELLEKAFDNWEKVKENQRNMLRKIHLLEEEKEELVRKIERLGAESSSTSTSRPISHDLDKDCCQYDETVPESDSHSSVEEDKDEHRSSSFGFGENGMEERNGSFNFVGDNSESHYNGKFGFGGGSHNLNQTDMEMESQTSQVPSASQSFGPITQNPYGHLNTQYYNPAQFFHRLSTTTVSRRGRGKRGGGSGSTRGRKRASEGSKGNSKDGTKQRSRKKNPHLDPAIEIVHASEEEIAMDQQKHGLTDNSKDDDNSTNREDSSGMMEQQNESPDKSYFDYTSTFLDETNRSEHHT